MQNIFDPLVIRGKSLYPHRARRYGGRGFRIGFIQRGVARENGIGTIASVDLRNLPRRPTCRITNQSE